MTATKANGTSFKKGHKKIKTSGRKAGQPNHTTQDLKDDIMRAAEEVGFVKEFEKLDDVGAPTGQTEKQWIGEEGRLGYLKWAAVYQPAQFLALLGRVLPLQMNVKSIHRVEVVKYPSLEEARQAALDKGSGKVILLSHFGRPKGRNPKESLKPVAAEVAIRRPVKFVDDCIGDTAERAVAAMKPRDFLCLENTRFHPGEEKNDPAFVAALAKLGDIFVNDAFSVAHRAQKNPSARNVA